MGARVAAVPDRLRGVERATADVGDAVSHAVGRLEEAAGALAALGRHEAGLLGSLARGVLAGERCGRALDSWVAAVGEAFDGLDAPPSTLWRDERGDGRLIEVYGDLTTARSVAVVVPGMGSDLANEPDHLGRNARRLYAEARRLDPHIAVVAWLGYDAPSVADVLLDDDARSAGLALVAFVDGLAHRADANVTVIGHSYGSVVVGEALRAGLAVDDVVVTGSPGMGAPSAAALAPPGTAVYAERAPWDPVAWSEAFGRDPSDPRFGATRLATGAGVDGHESYFALGTVALANLAAVVTQRDDLLQVVAPSSEEVVVGWVDDRWHTVVDAPVDAGQEAAALLDRGLDAAQASLPSGPWDDLLDAEQRLRHAALEEASRAVDIAERLASPDFLADAARDLWSELDPLDG